jgi:hypothetical protein
MMQKTLLMNSARALKNGFLTEEKLVKIYTITDNAANVIAAM